MRLFWQLMVFCTIALWADSALAQRRPIPDDTLGGERSIVTPSNNIRGLPGDRISGGAQRGDNLFHSFREFGVDVGRSVYFDGTRVRNIISRVTGGNPSEIFGTLGVLGNANLFLINPSGIVFGAGASLDVGGSFVGTTANGIQFGNQGFFNVSDPNAPTLLTVQPSAFLFNQIQGGAIVNNSIASLGDDGFGNSVFGLLVPNGQNLVLLGGNVINSGDLNAFGGRVELGSVGGTGTVGLNANGSLSFPNGLTRADVLITNGSRIDVASNNSGNIAINARNVDILGGSLLQAGIFPGTGTVDSQAGNIVLNGTGEINVGQSSLITNNVGVGGIGNSGNIDITAGSLFATDGAQLQAVTFGQGNAGNVIINARDRVLFDGVGTDGLPSAAFSTIGLFNFKGSPVGNGGNVEINTNSLEVRNGAQLQASTFGRGNAGNVIITGDRVLFDGVGTDGLPSAAFSTVGSIGFTGSPVGNGGNVEINTNSLEVRNGGQLQASTFGQGNAGDVIITGDRVLFDGVGSAAFSTVGSIGFTGSPVGNGGNVEINTNSLEVRNGGQLQASTFGQGNAGDVIITGDRVLFDGSGNGLLSAAFSTVGLVNFTGSPVGNGGNVEINTNSLEVRNGGQLQASTFGRGNAGNVIITGDRVLFDNGDAFSTVEPVSSEDTIRQGGDVSITAGSLNVINGASLQASTFGRGNAGNVIITGDRVLFDNGNAFSTVEPVNSEETVRQGGDVLLTAGSLDVINGASLQASTFGRGNAGDVIITGDRVLFNRGFAFSTVGSIGFTGNPVGNGGNVEINTNSLEVRNGGQLQASTFGRGNAGDVIITGDRVLFNGAGSNAFSRVEAGAIGRGGNINIDANSLIVRRGARLNANTFGQGDAGNVIITGDRILFNQGFAFSTVEPVKTEDTIRQGGDIRITAGSLNVINGAQLQAATFGRGNAGNVIITGDRVLFDGIGSAAFSTVGDSNFTGNSVGNGGNVEINTNSLEVRNGGQLQASTFGRGNAGDVVITGDRVLFAGAGSNAFSRVEAGAIGSGGNINIETNSLVVRNRARLTASTRGRGNAGNVIIHADDRMIVSNGALLTVDTNSRGRAGNIEIKADTVSLDGVGSDGRSSGLFTSAFAGSTRRGGEITIHADTVHLTDGAVINAQTETAFRGGNININANTFNVTGGGQVITTATSSGRAGDINLNITDRMTLSGFDPNYADRRRQSHRAITNQGATSGLFANTNRGSSGQGGTIQITTGQLEVSDRARVVVNSRGIGVAGNIDISAQSVQLDRGRLTAENAC